MIDRFIKINWKGFGRTAHWLSGVALFDYILREHFLSHIAAQLSAPSILFDRIDVHLAEHNRFRKSL